MNKIIITGAAGFIGHALTKSLLAKGFYIIGIDCMTGDYKQKGIKEYRLHELLQEPNFSYVNLDLSCDITSLNSCLIGCNTIIHLAASAGVRESMNEPSVFIRNNISAFANIIELAHKNGIKQFIYASSSSVYGNREIGTNGLTEDEITDCPQSVYAMTKKSNELLAYVYSSAYNMQTIGLRLFSVYGPYGRPDMAPWIFANSIYEDSIATIYNEGEMQRDFTYIDDVTNAIISIINTTIKDKYVIYNIGASNPHSINELYKIIEMEMRKSGKYQYKATKNGDVKATFANIDRLKKNYDIKSFTNIHTGLSSFCSWFQKYMAEKTKK